MKLLILLISLITTSCQNFPKHRTTDPTFDPYIKKFEKLYNEDTKDIPINFETLEIGTVASCYSLGKKREILVNDIYWDILTQYQKEIVVFHELGHCFFNRDHRVGYISFNGYYYCPASIMNYFIFSNTEIHRCYLINYDYYINELEHGREYDNRE